MDVEIIYSWCFNDVECFDSTPSTAIIILDKDLESFSSLISQHMIVHTLDKIMFLEPGSTRRSFIDGSSREPIVKASFCASIDTYLSSFTFIAPHTLAKAFLCPVEIDCPIGSMDEFEISTLIRSRCLINPLIISMASF